MNHPVIDIAKPEDIQTVLDRLASWPRPARLKLLAVAKQRLLAFRKVGKITTDQFKIMNQKLEVARQENTHGRH